MMEQHKRPHFIETYMECYAKSRVNVFSSEYFVGNTVGPLMSLWWHHQDKCSLAETLVNPSTNVPTYYWSALFHIPVSTKHSPGVSPLNTHSVELEQSKAQGIILTKAL